MTTTQSRPQASPRTVVATVAVRPTSTVRATSTVRPTGVERTLGQDEIIVTKTDLRGRITYANDVFLRISALEEDGTLGRPHSLIRHPEMPRGIFRLLWSGLEAGREVFAHIRNLGTDGAHYWVLAHVTPSLDSAGRPVGYHSNRRRPSTRAIGEVEAVHAHMRRAEAGLGASDAAEAGEHALHALLAGRGMTYAQWLWSLEDAE